jgi:hypothetical protein
LSAISQTFGGGTINPETSKGIAALEQTAGQAGIPPLGTAALTILGKGFGTRIMGFSAGDLFSKSNQGNIKNIEGDVSDMLKESKRIATAATSKGADLQQAISSLNKIEEGITSRYADANMALQASPADVAEGLDFVDDLSYSLRAVTEQRQALERYALTGDPNEVLLLVGTEEEALE